MYPKTQTSIGTYLNNHLKPNYHCQALESSRVLQPTFSPFSQPWRHVTNTMPALCSPLRHVSAKPVAGEKFNPGRGFGVTVVYSFVTNMNWHSQPKTKSTAYTYKYFHIIVLKLRCEKQVKGVQTENSTILIRRCLRRA